MSAGRRIVGLLAAWSLAMAAMSAAAGEKEVIVSAAASLRESVTALIDAYASAHPGRRVVVNFGGSGMLATQIEMGAPVDVFLAAGEAPMDRLVEAGLVDRRDVRSRLGNGLVLIAPAGSLEPRDWAGLAGAGVDRVAIGDPRTVPAGAYGVAALRHLGLFGDVEPRLVLGRDVRQVLAYVEGGEVGAGIVYTTDAALAGAAARVVARAPADVEDTIVYPLAPVAESRERPAVLELVEWLSGDRAREVFTAAGFRWRSG